MVNHAMVDHMFLDVIEVKIPSGRKEEEGEASSGGYFYCTREGVGQCERRGKEMMRELGGLRGEEKKMMRELGGLRGEKKGMMREWRKIVEGDREWRVS